jgi:hypothetical protein
METSFLYTVKQIWYVTTNEGAPFDSNDKETYSQWNEGEHKRLPIHAGMSLTLLKHTVPNLKKWQFSGKYIFHMKI